MNTVYGRVYTVQTSARARCALCIKGRVTCSGRVCTVQGNVIAGCALYKAL